MPSVQFIYRQLLRSYGGHMMLGRDLGEVNLASSQSVGYSYPGFHESWNLKISDPKSQRALVIHFSVLESANGFKKSAEVYAVFFQRDISTREIKKTALKQIYELRSHSQSSEQARIGDSFIGNTSTRGGIRSRNKTLEWDFKFEPRQSAEFLLVPEELMKVGIIRSSTKTLGEDLLFEGTLNVDGELIHWSGCPGTLSKTQGSKLSRSWVRGHCNAFVDEEGASSHFIFDGFTGRERILGNWPGLRFSAFYFFYREREFFFNSILDSLRVRSRNTLRDWNFQADRGELSFRGQASSEYKDFAGLTIEDTNGALVYSNLSALAKLTIHVYRHGKLESTFHSETGAALEIAGREKNPYVPLLI